MSPIARADKLEPAPVIEAEPKRVRNVPGALAEVHRVGEFISVNADESVMDKDLFTTRPENYEGTHNHFQGFQRLNDGEHFVISGGNWWPDRGSEIYVGQMGSRPSSGPWLSNLTKRDKIPPEDRLLRGITVDTELWHAGGMDVCGPILAVAVEHNDVSKVARKFVGAGRKHRDDESAICFFDMSRPSAPKFFKKKSQRIRRDGFKAGAVALTRLKNGYYLCGVWSDSDKKPKRLELYLSKRTVFDGAFHQKPFSTWCPKDAVTAERTINFQTVNFIRDVGGDLYLLGMGLDGNTHTVEIYRVTIPGIHAGPKRVQGSLEPRFQRLNASSRATFQCQTSQCDMRGASGVYAGDGLIVYSGAQYRGKRSRDPVRFAEFRRSLTPVSRVTKATAWVELYDNAEYGGARLTLQNLAQEGNIKNYKDLRVTGRHFGDRAQSAKYQIPKGYEYVLYEHHDYKKPIIWLRGTGEPEVEPDFAALGHRVSSSQWRRVGT